MKPSSARIAASLGLAVAALALSPLAHAQATAPVAGNSPVVKLKQGSLQGKDAGNGIAAFLGVPYAAAPVGPRRWQAPQPPARWTDVRQATSYGAPCAQGSKAGFGTMFARSESEDCLFLNIWAPAATSRSKLPVMVYIHGGAFVGGAGSIPTFNGSALAQRGVIVVTLNYRLGVFGFLAHPDLTRESPHHASGNYGLADQIAALRWVRENIAAFGGDPAQVTLFGQSAGSMSTLDLMTSPPARGLFRRAIAESGTPIPFGSRTLAQAEAQGRQFAASAGAAGIAALRSMSKDEVQSRWDAFAQGALGRAWPITDGWILPEAPAAAFAAHREARIPLLTGSNAREALAVPGAAELPERIRALYGDAAPQAGALYAGTTVDPVLGTPANQFATDTSFRCPAIVIEDWHARQGSPVFAYHFEEAAPHQEALGAQHSTEVTFVFGTTRMVAGGALPAQAAALQETMLSYVANFAKTGDPNGAGVPAWPRYTATQQAYLHLAGSGVRADTTLRADACTLYGKAAVPALLAGNGGG